jgi:hypothetical protein
MEVDTDADAKGLSPGSVLSTEADAKGLSPGSVLSTEAVAVAVADAVAVVETIPTGESPPNILELCINRRWAGTVPGRIVLATPPPFPTTQPPASTREAAAALAAVTAFTSPPAIMDAEAAAPAAAAANAHRRMLVNGTNAELRQSPKEVAAAAPISLT